MFSHLTGPNGTDAGMIHVAGGGVLRGGTAGRRSRSAIGSSTAAGTHAPALLDARAEARMVDAAALASPHDRPAIEAIAAARCAAGNPARRGAGHRLPRRPPGEGDGQRAPARWREEWRICRYGIHGLSVERAARRAAAVLARDGLHLVVCHLGGGASVTAVRGARSVDTTTGFGPLEGS